MTAVKDLLARKGLAVLSVGKNATALEAAQRMNDNSVGCLVVIDEGKVIGIFTERDILRRIVAERRDPGTTKVQEVMTREIVGCSMETDLEEARSVFKNRRIRHLPVVDDSKHLLGLISIGDLNAFEADTQEHTIYLMQEYIYGRT